MFNYIIWKGSDGIDIGFLKIRFYSLMFILSFLIGKKIMDYIFNQENKDYKKLEKIFIYTLISTIFGARLGHVIFYEKEIFIRDPLSVIFPFSFVSNIQFTGFQGLSSHGALIGVIISTVLVSYFCLYKSPLWLMDRIVLPFTLGGFFVRVGNFFNSEIIGKPCDAFFSVLFLNQNKNYGAMVPRHPSQIYEALLYLLLFIILMFYYIKTDKKKYLGWFFGCFMFSLWSIRFIVEFFKEEQGKEYIKFMNLNSGQLLSIPLIIMGLIFFFTSKYRKDYEYV